MKCVITRRARFSASHRYWLPELSEAENTACFGPCSRSPGHGHNYVLYVYMDGEVDEYGMVLNLSDVKRIIRENVTSQLDFSHLNDAWPEFQQTLPTTENIARVIWQRLSPHLRLFKIVLYENTELWAEYQGNDMEAYLTVSNHFSAAHRLALDSLSLEENTRIYGKCARPNGHGHEYHVQITVRGQIRPRFGTIVDLAALQKVIDDFVLEPLDHTFLNKDVPYFAEVVPTAENIASYIAGILQEPIRDLGVRLHKVRLIESQNNSCEVFCSGLETEAAAIAREPELAVR